jgi:short-subunit dehydrogenase
MTTTINKQWDDDRHLNSETRTPEPAMTDLSRTTALITGASSGIGATYADRLARRGHDLVLVARDGARMNELAAQLRAEAGVAIEVVPADLTDPAALAGIEARLREDSRIGLLVNNAGASLPGGFAAPDLDKLGWLIRLNVTAPTRLAGAIVPRLLAQGGGAIINIASVLGVAPEISPGIYAATKSFLLTFSQSLQTELGPRGLYVQAVLPAATRTEIWARAGKNIDEIPGVMEVGDMVDAALVGFDRRELVTIPPLADETQWTSFAAARTALLPGFLQAQPAPRYRQ